MIVFDSVSKKFKASSFTLEDISFKVEDGEFVFIVGPSGAGKTTILRLLNGEIVPTKGSVYINDWEINSLPKKKIPLLRRKVGFVFQDFKLLIDRTVFENIALALEIFGFSGAKIAEKVKKVLKTVKLKGKENYFPRQLSLGEQQRVALGRAIAGETEIIIADEPTGNLDPKTAWEILRIFKDINKSGKTVIMATHNVDIVNSLKKRVIVLKKGKITKDKKKGKYS